MSFQPFEKGSAAFEGEVLSDAGQGKEFAQRPADPEVFLNAGRTQKDLPLCDATSLAPFLSRELEKVVHLLPVLRELVEDLGDPGGSQVRVLEQARSVFRLERSAQLADDVLIDVPLPEGTQGLDHQAARPAGRRHEARRSSLQDDLAVTHLDAPTAAIGEEHGSNRYLLRQSQGVGRMGTG